MITYYGMNSSKTMLNLDIIEDKKSLIKEAKSIAESLYEEALKDLYHNKHILEDIANTLLENETLYDSDVEEILNKHNKKSELS